MDDLLDIESSQENNQDFTAEPHDTIEVLYDEGGYDDNNAWESFMEKKRDSEYFPENVKTSETPVEQFPEDKFDHTHGMNATNSAVSIQKTAISPILSTATGKKNEIRDLLMDLF
jgi:hypothetical protein